MSYKLTFEDGSSAYLEHFGVKGMHWGVWNDETRARRMGLKQRKSHASEKLSGNRYTKDGLNLERDPKISSFSNTVVGAYGWRDKSEATTKEFSRLKDSMKKLDASYNDYWDLAMDSYYKVIKDPKTKKEALARMKKDLGDYAGDADFVYLSAYDAVTDVISERTRKTPEGKKVMAYESQLNDWFSDVSKTTDRLVSEIGNRPINTRYGKTDYKDVVTNTLLEAQGNGFMSYVARHGVIDEVNGNMSRTEDLVEAVSVQFMKSVSADPKELYWLRNDPKEYD